MTKLRFTSKKTGEVQEVEFKNDRQALLAHIVSMFGLLTTGTGMGEEEENKLVIMLAEDLAGLGVTASELQEALNTATFSSADMLHAFIFRAGIKSVDDA